MIQNPKNWGRPNNKEISVWHAYEGPCGAIIHFFLKNDNDINEKAHFITEGCGTTGTAGSQTTKTILI